MSSMYLEKINSPQDLRKLNIEELPQVASEVRQKMIQGVSSSGGHLASSLGATELIISLHYCFNTPEDKIIYDVGHQAYAHKILTGRAFETLRKENGISGFPCKDESEYDSFTTGHSSTAVSLAMGLVCARDASLTDKQFKVVAVIGDGSLSGGLCFEGLNNAGHLKKDILVVLNTNEMSIAPNVGALSTYLNKIISMPIYNRFKNSFEELAQSRLPKGSRLVKLANKFEEGLKGLFVPGIFFEELGFRYFGPFDGNNIPLLVPAIRNIIGIKGPRLLHVITKKGKGYPPAEKEPVRFHGTSPFDINTGIPLPNTSAATLTYTQVFSSKLVDLARADKSIFAITAAMPEGTGLDKFRDLYPERFFDVGIAEEHAVSFAAGLARQGARPVVAIYSTFLQRAYDQIIECVALQNLPVVFAVDRAGIVGEDGATHQGIFDIGYLRTIPRLVIMAPRDGLEFEAMLEFALKLKTPVAIRYPRALCPSYQLPADEISLGKSEIIKEGSDYALVALGSMTVPCLQAMQAIEKGGYEGALLNARFVRPLDIERLKELAKSVKKIFTVEEGIIDSGFGSAVSEALGIPVIKLGLPCDFIAHASRDSVLKKYGLDKDSIARRVIQELGDYA